MEGGGVLRTWSENICIVFYISLLIHFCFNLSKLKFKLFTEYLGMIRNILILFVTLPFLTE